MKHQAQQQAQQAQQQAQQAQQQAQQAQQQAQQAQQQAQQEAQMKHQAQQQAQQAQQQKEEADVKVIFRDSIANTHPNLYYEVTAVQRLAPPQSLVTGYERFISDLPGDCTLKERHRRFVFHTCKDATTLGLIEQNGMRPSHCRICRRLEPWIDHDCGWFGDHTKGVYVSKHADYTFYYQRDRDPRPGDEGTVLVLEMVTGKVKHFNERRDGAAPSAGYHCHETMNFLEFYVWDSESTSEPPRPTHRLLPMFVVSWRAVQNDRATIKHEGLQ
jgi:flagellar motor protein MotB